LQPPPTAPSQLTASNPFGLASTTLNAFDAASFTHAEWVDGKVHETGFTTAFTPNTIVPYPGQANTDMDFVSAGESGTGDTYAAITARANHGAGVNVLLMDGSVRFVANSITITTWRALGTRAGGETTGSDF